MKNKFTEFFHAIEERVASAFEWVLYAWIRLKEARTHSKIERERARAEAKARLIEAKANAEFTHAQARYVDEERRQARKQFQAAVWARRRRALAKAFQQFRGKPASWVFTILAAGFGLATFLGVALHITWMWTLFPWLTILAMRFRGFAKVKKLVRKNFPRVLLPRLSTLWLGIWAIFVIVSR